MRAITSYVSCRKILFNSGEFVNSCSAHVSGFVPVSLSLVTTKGGCWFVNKLNGTAQLIMASTRNKSWSFSSIKWKLSFELDQDGVDVLCFLFCVCFLLGLCSATFKLPVEFFFCDLNLASFPCAIGELCVMYHSSACSVTAGTKKNLNKVYFNIKRNNLKPI